MWQDDSRAEGLEVPTSDRHDNKAAVCVPQGWDSINKEHLEKEWGEKKQDWDKRAKSK